MDANVKASLLQHIAKAEGGMLMDNMQAALGLMLRTGLAYKARVSCAVIGVHEDNRDGVAIDVQHMQTLIQSISGMGWVEDEGKRVAIELQDDAGSDKTRSFNMKLHLESEGKLPRGDAGGPRSQVRNDHGIPCEHGVKSFALRIKTPRSVAH